MQELKRMQGSSMHARLVTNARIIKNTRLELKDWSWMLRRVINARIEKNARLEYECNARRLEYECKTCHECKNCQEYKTWASRLALRANPLSKTTSVWMRELLFGWKTGHECGDASSMQELKRMQGLSVNARLEYECKTYVRFVTWMLRRVINASIEKNARLEYECKTCHACKNC